MMQSSSEFTLEERYSWQRRLTIDQSKQFKQWSDSKQYLRFHHNHYDWWAFPLNQRSSHGIKYKVYDEHIKLYQQDQEFIDALRANAIYVCMAWGYDLIQGKKIQQPEKDQEWQDWPIRLNKLSKSLELFRQDDLWKNSIHYAMSLIESGQNFTFGAKDLKNYYLKAKLSLDKKIQMNQKHQYSQEKNQVFLQKVSLEKEEIIRE